KPKEPIDPRQALDLEPEQLPRHIAIIMDGNGRWAKQRNLPRIRGHEQGVQAVRAATTDCARLGLEALTLFSFSAENWKRPKQEVDFLMQMCRRYLVAERDELMENNIRLIHVGRREGLPDAVLHELDITVELSQRNTGLKVGLALNYGSRSELVDAVRKIVRRAQDGELSVDRIDEGTITDALYTAGLPDPDLLIRTASEYRISNFLLWQISYAELYVTDVLWPDFRTEHLLAAIKEYARRERRFGDVGESG
ncbi:MAG: isoprenyl transferase, partial [Phycisphaerales bacterium]